MRPVYIKGIGFDERKKFHQKFRTVKITTATELSNPVVQNDTDNLNKSYKLCE